MLSHQRLPLLSLLSTARALLAASLVLGLAPAVGGAQQVHSANPFRACDGRIDLTRLPGSASARHVITASGSYFLGRNVQCDPGQTAIEIGPGASSVVIDGNGFAVLGHPGRTSPHAVHSPPAPVARELLRLEHLTAQTFAGHVVLVEDLRQLHAQGTLSDGDSSGLVARRRGDVILEDLTCSRLLGTAVDVEEVASLSLLRCRVSECGAGVRACAASVQVTDCDVSDVDGDGLLFDDACSTPGVPATGKAISTKGTGFNRCAGNGVQVVTTGPGSVELTLATTNIGSSGLDGVRVSLPPSSKGRVLILGGSISSNGGNGVLVGSGEMSVSVDGASLHDNAADGLQVVGAPGCPDNICIRAANIGSSGCDGVDVRHGRLSLSDVTIGASGQHGVRVEGGSLECVESNIGSSGLDGVSLLSASGKFYRGSVVGNAGLGVAMREANEGFFDRVAVCGNGQGGVLVEGSTACASTSVRVSECHLVANGGVALDLRSAQGGEVRACTVSGSSTGIRVGDGSGLACAAGVRVSDNSVSECGSGIEVLDPGGHLVVRNYVAQCLSSFAVVTPGNLLGPVVVSDADVATSCNPHSNYAP